MPCCKVNMTVLSIITYVNEYNLIITNKDAQNKSTILDTLFGLFMECVINYVNKDWFLANVFFMQNGFAQQTFSISMSIFSNCLH
jgi:hypothetical protein